MYVTFYRQFENIIFNEITAFSIGLVDRVFAVYAGSRGFDSHRRHMSERFFRSNRPGYQHPVCSERRRWRPDWRIKLTKLYMCTQTHYKHKEDGRTAPGVRGHGSVSLSHSGNVDTSIELHTRVAKLSNQPLFEFSSKSDV